MLCKDKTTDCVLTAQNITLCDSLIKSDSNFPLQELARTNNSVANCDSVSARESSC